MTEKHAHLRQTPSDSKIKQSQIELPKEVWDLQKSLPLNQWEELLSLLITRPISRSDRDQLITGRQCRVRLKEMPDLDVLIDIVNACRGSRRLICPSPTSLNQLKSVIPVVVESTAEGWLFDMDDMAPNAEDMKILILEHISLNQSRRAFDKLMTDPASRVWKQATSDLPTISASLYKSVQKQDTRIEDHVEMPNLMSLALIFNDGIIIDFVTRVSNRWTLLVPEMFADWVPDFPLQVIANRAATEHRLAGYEHLLHRLRDIDRLFVDPKFNPILLPKQCALSARWDMVCARASGLVDGLIPLVDADRMRQLLESPRVRISREMADRFKNDTDKYSILLAKLSQTLPTEAGTKRKVHPTDEDKRPQKDLKMDFDVRSFSNLSYVEKKMFGRDFRDMSIDRQMAILTSLKTVSRAPTSVFGPDQWESFPYHSFITGHFETDSMLFDLFPLPRRVDNNFYRKSDVGIIRMLTVYCRRMDLGGIVRLAAIISKFPVSSIEALALQHFLAFLGYFDLETLQASAYSKIFNYTRAEYDAVRNVEFKSGLDERVVTVRMGHRSQVLYIPPDTGAVMRRSITAETIGDSAKGQFLQYLVGLRSSPPDMLVEVTSGFARLDIIGLACNRPMLSLRRLYTPVLLLPLKRVKLFYTFDIVGQYCSSTDVAPVSEIAKNPVWNRTDAVNAENIEEFAQLVKRTELQTLVMDRAHEFTLPSSFSVFNVERKQHIDIDRRFPIFSLVFQTMTEASTILDSIGPEWLKSRFRFAIAHTPNVMITPSHDHLLEITDEKDPEEHADVEAMLDSLSSGRADIKSLKFKRAIQAFCDERGRNIVQHSSVDPISALGIISQYMGIIDPEIVDMESLIRVVSMHGADGIYLNILKTSPDADWINKINRKFKPDDALKIFGNMIAASFLSSSWRSVAPLVLDQCIECYGPGPVYLVIHDYLDQTEAATCDLSVIQVMADRHVQLGADENGDYLWDTLLSKCERFNTDERVHYALLHFIRMWKLIENKILLSSIMWRVLIICGVSVGDAFVSFLLESDIHVPQALANLLVMNSTLGIPVPWRDIAHPEAFVVREAAAIDAAIESLDAGEEVDADSLAAEHATAYLMIMGGARELTRARPPPRIYASFLAMITSPGSDIAVKKKRYLELLFNQTKLPETKELEALLGDLNTPATASILRIHKGKFAAKRASASISESLARIVQSDGPIQANFVDQQQISARLRAELEEIGLSESEAKPLYDPVVEEERQVRLSLQEARMMLSDIQRAGVDVSQLSFMAVKSAYAQMRLNPNQDQIRQMRAQLELDAQFRAMPEGIENVLHVSSDLDRQFSGWPGASRYGSQMRQGWVTKYLKSKNIDWPTWFAQNSGFPFDDAMRRSLRDLCKGDERFARIAELCFKDSQAILPDKSLLGTNSSGEERAVKSIETIYEEIKSAGKPLPFNPEVLEWACLAKRHAVSHPVAELWTEELGIRVPDTPLFPHHVHQKHSDMDSVRSLLRHKKLSEVLQLVQNRQYAPATFEQLQSCIIISRSLAENIASDKRSADYPDMMAFAILNNLAVDVTDSSVRLVELLLFKRRFLSLEKTVHRALHVPDLSNFASLSQSEQKTILDHVDIGIARSIARSQLNITAAILDYVPWWIALTKFKPERLALSRSDLIFDRTNTNDIIQSFGNSDYQASFEVVVHRTGRIIYFSTSTVDVCAQLSPPDMCSELAVAVFDKKPNLSLALLKRANNHPSTVPSAMFANKRIFMQLVRLGLRAFPKQFEDAGKACIEAYGNELSVTATNPLPKPAPLVHAMWDGSTSDAVEHITDVSRIGNYTLEFRKALLSDLLMDHFFRRQPIQFMPHTSHFFPPIECFSDKITLDERTPAIAALMMSLPDWKLEHDKVPLTDLLVFFALELGIANQSKLKRGEIGSSVLLKRWDDKLNLVHDPSQLEIIWPRSFHELLDFKGNISSVTMNPELYLRIINDGLPLHEFANSIHHQLIRGKPPAPGNVHPLFRPDALPIMIRKEDIEYFLHQHPEVEETIEDVTDQGFCRLIAEGPDAYEGSWMDRVHRHKMNDLLHGLKWTTVVPDKTVIRWAAKEPASARALMSSNLTLNDICVMPETESVFLHDRNLSAFEIGLMSGKTSPVTEQDILQLVCLCSEYDVNRIQFGVIDSIDESSSFVPTVRKGNFSVNTNTVLYPFRSMKAVISLNVLRSLNVYCAAQSESEEADWGAMVPHMPSFTDAMWDSALTRFNWPTDPLVLARLCESDHVREIFRDRFINTACLAPACIAGDEDLARMIVRACDGFTMYDAWLLHVRFDIVLVQFAQSLRDIEGPKATFAQRAVWNHFCFLSGIHYFRSMTTKSIGPGAFSLDSPESLLEYLTGPLSHTAHVDLSVELHNMGNRIGHKDLFVKVARALSGLDFHVPLTHIHADIVSKVEGFKKFKSSWRTLLQAEFKGPNREAFIEFMCC